MKNKTLIKLKNFFDILENGIRVIMEIGLEFKH